MGDGEVVLSPDATFSGRMKDEEFSRGGGCGGHFEPKEQQMQRARGRKGLGLLRSEGKDRRSWMQSPEGCAKEFGFSA